MAERKAVNKYYPPDWTPDKGSINKYVGQHPLRERAKKLSQGILVIRFELPYNIWCGGCGSHVGMGVRYNAEKKKVGNYYSTPIYRFRMKCHLCDNYFEIETDPKNCDYTVVSGARRKNEQWEPSATETVETTESRNKNSRNTHKKSDNSKNNKEDAKRMAIDAMFKLEHGVEDVQKSKKVAPVLHQLKEVQSIWKDDYAANKLLRKKFREEKKNIADVKKADDELRKKGSLDIALVPENPEDIERAKKIRFYNTGFDAHKRSKRREIEEKSWFNEASTNPLASKLPSLISHRKRKSTASDEKDEWKNSVVVKTSSTNGKSETRSCENEEKRPDLNSSGQDPYEKTEKHNQIRDCRVNHTTSIDEDVLVTSTSRSEFLPDSSPLKLCSAINSNHEWSKEEDTSRTCVERPLSTSSEESLSKKECPSSGLVSSLYSSGSSDDESELQ